MKYILGIDVGGTKIASGLVDEKLKVTDIRTIPTSQTDLVTQLIELISSYEKYEAIGVGMPGQVLKDGTVTRLPNVENFEPVNLKRVLQEKFKFEVEVINDAKAFTLAEAVAGVGKDAKVVAGAILGTGIGAGLVSNKKLYFGKDGLAGELEHIVLLDGEMVREHRHEAGQFKTAEDTKKYIKTLLDMIVLSWNPDVIVLGGAWSRLPGLVELANQLTVEAGGYNDSTPVKLSQLENAGIIGAALGVLNQ